MTFCGNRKPNIGVEGRDMNWVTPLKISPSATCQQRPPLMYYA